jgi:uncharacterized membrane protein HdeD (DUF308 family)
MAGGNCARKQGFGLFVILEIDKRIRVGGACSGFRVFRQDHGCIGYKKGVQVYLDLGYTRTPTNKSPRSAFMNEGQQKPFRGVFTPHLGDLEKNWRWMMTLGIIFIILGAIGLGMDLFLTIASVLAFGVLLLIGGLSQLVHAVMYCKGWHGILTHAVNALLYLVVGAVIVNDPLVASALLTLIIGISLIMIGILRAVTALQNRGALAWQWALFSGVLSILIGFMIMAHWPASGLWAIGLFVALELIIAGWSYVLLADSIRKRDQRMDDQTAN